MVWKIHFRKRPDDIVDERAFDDPNPRLRVRGTYPLCGSGKYGIICSVTDKRKEVTCKKCLKLKCK